MSISTHHYYTYKLHIIIKYFPVKIINFREKQLILEKKLTFRKRKKEKKQLLNITEIFKAIFFLCTVYRVINFDNSQRVSIFIITNSFQKIHMLFLPLFFSSSIYNQTYLSNGKVILREIWRVVNPLVKIMKSRRIRKRENPVRFRRENKRRNIPWYVSFYG